MTVQPHLKSDNGQPVVEVNQRLILQLDGFVQALAIQQDIRRQLTAVGVLKQTNVSETETTKQGD
nr:hypothetical protein [Sporomusa silvacetica]